MLSCAEISERIEKSLSLTTKILNELVEEGYVVETGHAPSSGGRRPQMYSLKPDIMYTVSVAMDQFVTRLVVMDMQNRHIGKMESIELNLAGNPGALDIITDKISEVIDEAGIAKSKIAGIGISMPGFIDAKEGVNYSFPGNGQGTITSFIESKTGVPVFIDNDSSLIALAEQKFGAALNKKNVMVINVGWGIGLGLILNNVLFRGDNGFAGEFSHIPLFQNGKLCSCGKSGCLETEAALTAVIEKALEGLASGRTSVLKKSGLEALNPEDAADAVIDAAAKGDRFAVELLSEAGYNIGRGIAILIHLLNPELVVLSGRGSSSGKILQAPIQQALNEHCIPRLAANTTIVISGLGHEAQLIGGAALVMEKYEKGIARKNKIQEAA
ncbi:ROK family protein [Agriterribacter sp.]|uniref:ROK family transcriptional regulator n=1 Tax=Agriterribacter sp. TaxID=2821509 RepID=UPI002B9FE503|nr:ROK family protein [Agriterribacter sp.]HRO45389.1 ROK family protein [Agriterribacter sp.]HRQ16919.1 ROK family protein [Agriterribacter sp.]